jgi:hypothetical protein
MFKKISHLTEQAATRASRRDFLHGLGRLAGGAALLLAGLATHAALGGRPGSGLLCCYYCYCLDRDCERSTCNHLCTDRGRCPQRSGGHRLSYAFPTTDCGQCSGL